jgi:3-polyprenyl-4-hydroxybenzoate decarboxylase
MACLTEIGVIIVPPMPAFYTNTESTDGIVIHSVSRVLDLFDTD